jgi:uncharacterized membrane protein
MPTSRIEAFSDGVFAIVITLLIFSIQVPQIQGDAGRTLGPTLLAMLLKFLSYALSFGVVCVWWVAHHHLFILFSKSDRGLLWLNSLFLFWLASVPFPTALLGDYPHERIAVVCYGAVMTLAGLSFSVMRFYGFYIARLATVSLDQNLMRRTMSKSAMNPVMHLVAVLLRQADLFFQREIDSFPHSVSSILWHNGPSYIQEDQKTFYMGYHEPPRLSRDHTDFAR